jgi:hypothetical protein
MNLPRKLGAFKQFDIDQRRNRKQVSESFGSQVAGFKEINSNDWELFVLHFPVYENEE